MKKGGGLGLSRCLGKNTRVGCEKESIAPIINDKQIKNAEKSSSVSSSPSSTKLLILPMNYRLRFYKYVKSALNKYKNICNEITNDNIKLYERIGSGTYGLAFLTKIKYKDRDLFVATKIMNNKDLISSNEINYYLYFTNFVIDNINPHFPLIYKTLLCETPLRIEDTSATNSKSEKYFIFNELANGDLESWLKEKKHSNEGLISMICQVIMGCMSLELCNLIHNDLHTGNILYHNIEKNTDKYTHYKLARNNIYILNKGQHWIIWDLGTITEPNKRKSIQIDIIYLIQDIKRSIKLKEEDKKLYETIELFINSNNNINYYNLLEFLIVILNKDQQILLINPVTPPNKSKIINKVPYNLYDFHQKEVPRSLLDNDDSF